MIRIEGDGVCGEEPPKSRASKFKCSEQAHLLGSGNKTGCSGLSSLVLPELSELKCYIDVVYLGVKK